MKFKLTETAVSGDNWIYGAALGGRFLGIAGCLKQPQPLKNMAVSLPGAGGSCITLPVYIVRLTVSVDMIDLCSRDLHCK